MCSVHGVANNVAHGVAHSVAYDIAHGMAYGLINQNRTLELIQFYKSSSFETALQPGRFSWSLYTSYESNRKLGLFDRKLKENYSISLLLL